MAVGVLPHEPDPASTKSNKKGAVRVVGGCAVVAGRVLGDLCLADESAAA